MKTRKKILIATAAVTGVAATGLIFTLATHSDLIAPGRASHWMVTYEVSTEPADALTGTTISYLTQDDPEAPVMEIDAEDVEPSGRSDGEFSWFGNGKIMAQKPAKVSVTPPADVSARCRITVDEGVELTTKTGAPGEPIVCEKETAEWYNGLLGRLRIG